MARSLPMDLAYTVAYGKRRFRWAAELAARSLIEFGGFAGEVVVFTDRPGPAIPRVTWKVVADEKAGARGNWMKHGAREHLDLPTYDRVMMFDADLLVRSPITHLLDRCDETRVVVTDDLGGTVRGGHCNKMLTAEELDRCGEQFGINGGLMIGRGAVIDRALAAWRKWQHEEPNFPGPGFDQPPLNAAVVRGEILTDLVLGLMWFPNRDPGCRWAGSDAPFVHYHGIGRHLNRYWRMRLHYGRLRRAARRAGG